MYSVAGGGGGVSINHVPIALPLQESSSSPDVLKKPRHIMRRKSGLPHDFETAQAIHSYQAAELPSDTPSSSNEDSNLPAQ